VSALRKGMLRHWPAAVLLAAGLVLRVLAQVSYRPALLYIDSLRYIYNAQGMDPVGYKGPLRAILAVGDFSVVAAVQHLLGLAVAVVIYVLIMRRGASRWLAALAIAPVLLDAYQVQAEQMIMPTVWFEALTVAGIAILLWRPGAGWRRVIAAGVMLGGTATFAQIGEALLPAAVIFVLVAAGGGWRRAMGKAAVLCAAFALPILAYSTGSYLLTGDFFLSHTGITSLYGRMAAAADCATLRLTTAERGMCPTRSQQARGPDWLEYGTTSPIRPYYADLPRAEADSLIADFNRRVITQQPLRVLGAYSRDVVKIFALTRSQSPGDTPISRWQFQLTYPYFTNSPGGTTPQIDRAVFRRFGGGTPTVWRPGAAFLRAYQLDGGYTSGALLALFTVTGAIGSVAALRRRIAPRTRELASATLLFFCSGWSILLISDIFEFSWRYQIPALVTLVPAGVLGIGVITSGLQRKRGLAPSVTGELSRRTQPVGGGAAQA
jgi:hypothetical protein